MPSRCRSTCVVTARVAVRPAQQGCASAHDSFESSGAVGRSDAKPVKRLLRDGKDFATGRVGRGARARRGGLGVRRRRSLALGRARQRARLRARLAPAAAVEPGRVRGGRPAPCGRVPAPRWGEARHLRAPERERRADGLRSARRRRRPPLRRDVVPRPAPAPAQRRGGLRARVGRRHGTCADANRRRPLVAAGDAVPQRPRGDPHPRSDRLERDANAHGQLLRATSG